MNKSNDSETQADMTYDNITDLIETIVGRPSLKNSHITKKIVTVESLDEVKEGEVIVLCKSEGATYLFDKVNVGKTSARGGRKVTITSGLHTSGSYNKNLSGFRLAIYSSYPISPENPRGIGLREFVVTEEQVKGGMVFGLERPK